jgi:hypothetical protein
MAQLRSDLPDLAGLRFNLAGSATIIPPLAEQLAAAGVPPEHIVAEA